MKKKISLGLAIAIALILVTVSAALAAGLGLFARLGQSRWGDERLADLDAVSAPVGKTVTTPDGVTVAIEQAYYCDDRLFISYRLSGNISEVELGEGKPDHEWKHEDPAAAYAMAFDEEDPESLIIGNWLNNGTDRWARHRFAVLHDGLSLADGTYLDIIGGDSITLEDLINGKV